jgi:hypothetical protein
MVITTQGGPTEARGGELMALDMNNPSIRIGVDCVRQLLETIDYLMITVTYSNINTIDDERYNEINMAVREAKEWIGEEPDCGGGVCRL